MEDAEGDLVRVRSRVRARVRARARVGVRVGIGIGVRVRARGSEGLGSAQARHVKLGRALVQLFTIDCGHLGRGKG